MEDVSARGKAGSGELRRRLERAREPDSYDLEAGLRRHRELVARGVPPPAWASASVRPRVAAARWLMGLSALMMGAGALWASQRGASVPDALPSIGSTGAASSAATMAGPGPVGAPPALSPPALTTRAPEPAAAPETSQPDTASSGELPNAAVPEAAGPTSATGASAGARGTTAAAVAVPPATPPATEAVAPAPSASAARATAAPRRRREVAEPSSAQPAPAPVAEPTLAELARQSVATAESAPSVPASRPAAVSASPAPRGGVTGTPGLPPAAPAAPRNLVIEAERPGVVAEMQELSRAEALLGRDPAQALKLVQASMAEHPQGYLTEERRYVEVLALIGLRRVEEARLLGREFGRLYPQSPYRRRVEAAIATAVRAQ
jgi:hypothetical protein